MGKISNYEKKFHTLVNRQGGCCAIAAANGEFATPTELHHARCHDTKWSRMKWPLFIDSIVNLMAVSHEWHMKRGGLRPLAREADRVVRGSHEEQSRARRQMELRRSSAPAEDGLQ